MMHCNTIPSRLLQLDISVETAQATSSFQFTVFSFSVCGSRSEQSSPDLEKEQTDTAISNSLRKWREMAGFGTIWHGFENFFGQEAGKKSRERKGR